MWNTYIRENDLISKGAELAHTDTFGETGNDLDQGI